MKVFGKILISGVLLILITGTILYFYNSNSVSKYKIIYMGSSEYSPYWKKLGDAVNQVAKENKVVLDDYTPFGQDFETKTVMSERFLREGYGAVIFGDGGDEIFAPRFIEDAKDAGVPIFTIDTPIDEKDMEGFVGIGNNESGRVVGKYILGRVGGGKDVLIIAANYIHGDSIDRAESAKKVLEDGGNRVKIINVDSDDWLIDNVSVLVREEFNKNPDYSAVFAVWDEAIVSVSETLDEMGLGDDVVLVGFDGLDIVLKRIKSGDISATISQPVNLMAKNSLDQVSAYFEGRDFDKRILLSGELVDGENVDKYLN